MPAGRGIALPLFLLFVVLVASCGGRGDAAPSVENTAEAQTAAGVETTPAEGSLPALDGAPIVPTEQIPGLLQSNRWSWEELLERRVIRALVAYNKTSFFLDQGRQRGIAADAFVELQKYLDETYDTGARKFSIAAIPVPRDQLFPLLEEGHADIAVANLTITEERQEQVDFTVPTSKLIDEVVVTGPASPTLDSLEDLAGQTVHVREGSSFWGSLERLDASFRERGLEPIDLEPASPYLETEDLLEMVNAGLIPITVADSHVAAFWKDVFTDLVVHEELKVAEGRRIAWAVRKDATGLKEVLDPWIESNRQGTLLGNMLVKRYLQTNPWVKNAAAESERQKFLSMVELFQKYGEQYGLEPILVAAQGYQESGLDQSKVSHVGAVGVMQVMPSTATDPAVGIPNIHELESNIHAGSKYLAHLIDVYFDDPGIDQENRLLFAFAGYNAGPNRINRLREVAKQEGLDPNRWFGNVELVVAREVGREPVQYVSNIYKYAIAYALVLEQRERRERLGG